MPVIWHENLLKIVRLELDPAEIPRLLAKHSQKWEPAARLEAEARSLIATDYSPDASQRFALEVIRWGGGHRFAGRFEALNAAGEVASALKRAVALTDQGRVGAGVEAVRELRRLGQSFASKIVRFLRPDKAVILDSIIRNALGYAESMAGYEEFLADCRAIRDSASDANPELRVCDVEAAVFAKIQGY